MATFAGPRRRFDFHLKTDQVVLIDDYCPSSGRIATGSILSVKELYAGRKVTVFSSRIYIPVPGFRW